MKVRWVRKAVLAVRYSNPPHRPHQFDPASSPFTSSQGYFDITPSGDGGVLKLPIHVPSDPQSDIRLINPVEGCMVDVQYVGKLLNGEVRMGND